MFFRLLQWRTTALLTFGLLPLIGCSSRPVAQTSPAPAAAAVAPATEFSLDTPVDTIAADQRGKAVLDRDLPDLMASRSYPLFDDMSLSQIATVSGGRLTSSKLDAVQADLAGLSHSTP